jgi:hemoglobin-like flavoprotein
MTPEQIAVIADQAGRVGRSPELAKSFYAHLFALQPGIRSMFPEDLAGQRRRFAAEFDALVRGVTHPSGMAARAGSLGRIHQVHGVTELHYETAGSALRSALADVLPEWDQASADAWDAAFDLMAEAMLDGYE